MPVPLVSVRNCERKPIRPRAGMRNSRRTRPLPWFTIFVIMPRRVPTCAMTTPWKSSGTSMTSSSTGSTRRAVDLLGDDLRPRDLQLEALAPHHLDQDRQLQLAAADDLHLLGRVGVLDAERDVAEQLRVEPIAQVARGDVLAVAAGQRRGVDAEDHRHRRLVDRDRRDRHRVLDGSAIVSPMVMSSMPARQTMSPAAASLDVDALQAVEGEQLGDLASAGRVPSSLHDRDRVVRA